MFEAIIYIFNISICYGISFNHPCKQYLFGRKWIQIMRQLIENVLLSVSFMIIVVIRIGIRRGYNHVVCI